MPYLSYLVPIWSNLDPNLTSQFSVNLSRPDPPENCQLNVQKLPKTWHFCQQNCQWQFCWKKWQFLSTFFWKKNSSFWQYFDIQVAIFRRVRSVLKWTHSRKEYCTLWSLFDYILSSNRPVYEVFSLSTFFHNLHKKYRFCIIQRHYPGFYLN